KGPQPRVEGEEQVRDRLRLDPLGCVHHENRPLARGERARHLVGEVHVSRRVDQVQLVQLAVAGVIAHPDGVQLDRDAAFALQIHRVEHLLAHQALVERPGELDEAVGQGRLPVVDVGDDAEVADVILAHVGLEYSRPSSVVRGIPWLRTTDDGWPRARYTPRGTPLAPITGWFDPAPKGGFLRLAANSYLPAKGDPPVRLPGLRRGDLLTLENGRVLGVNGAAPGAPLADRPEFAQLGAVHPSRPLSLETPRASSPR